MLSTMFLVARRWSGDLYLQFLFTCGFSPVSLQPTPKKNHPSAHLLTEKPTRTASNSTSLTKPSSQNALPKIEVAVRLRLEGLC
jgi:hypothetical protein